MGNSCDTRNMHVYPCACGYSISNQNGLPSHTWASSYIANTKFHVITCAVCNNAEKPGSKGDHIINGVKRTSCMQAGQCSICSGTFAASHSAGFTFNRDGTVSFPSCEFCGKSIGKVSGSWSNEELAANGSFNGYCKVCFSSNVSNMQVIWGPTTTHYGRGTISNNSFNFGSNFVEDFFSGQFTDRTSEIDDIHEFGVAFTDSSGQMWGVIVYTQLLPDMTAPTINCSLATNSTVNGWATSNTINVTGTENYCSTVMIQMRDTTTNEIVYSGRVGVNNRNYSLSINPNGSINASGRQYEITATDTFNYSSSKTITLSKLDNEAPIFDKTNQLLTENGEQKWATGIGWSKNKDFSIRAYDEGTNIAQIKIQNITSTKTGVVFADTYGVTSQNNSTTPTKYQREYGFAGDVKDYVTIKVDSKDYANNVSTEYFRVYNLDNSAPTIMTVNYDEVSTAGILKATIRDSYSGIKYFGILKADDGVVNYPSTYSSGGGTYTAAELGKWYQVPLISANSSTNTPESGQASADVNFNIHENGRHFIIMEDYVGNREYFEVNVNNFDNDPPYGTITLKTPIILYNGTVATNTSLNAFIIDGYDDKGTVVEMALANEDDRDTINWLAYDEAYKTDGFYWELSAGDGVKTIFVMLKDNSGNVSATFATIIGIS